MCLTILIFEEQGGFLEGRQIMDEIVIVVEVIHSMGIPMEKAMFNKLDMATTYDRVKWAF